MNISTAFAIVSRTWQELWSTAPVTLACLLAMLMNIGSAAADENKADDRLLLPDYWERQPVMTIPPARPGPPDINGHVNYQEWFYAGSIMAFMDTDTEGQAPHPVRMYLNYDNEAVYVGLVIHRPEMHPTPKATYQAGYHSSIWWRDDNFELVIEPGGPYGYAFVGNSVGGWSSLRYSLDGAGSDATWQGEWEYHATRAGRESWHAELKIPYSQFEDVQPPQPGDQWRLAVMAQQVTPHRQMFDWTHMWSFGQSSYRSPNKARLIFGTDNDPIFRFSEIGQMRPTGQFKEQDVTPMGMRTILYHQGREPATVVGRADLYKSDIRANGELGFMGLWDRILTVRDTGQPLRDPNDPTQAFRNEADLLRELNERYQFYDHIAGSRTVSATTPGFFALQLPQAYGDYVIGYEFRDHKTGRVMASQVVPFRILPRFDVTLSPYFLTHEKLRVELRAKDLPQEAAGIRLALYVAGREIAQRQIDLPEHGDQTHVYLDTRDWAQQQEGKVEAELVDTAGRVLEQASASLRRPATPSWFGQGLGTSQVVPPPFEPVRATAANTAAVWARTYQLADNGLPMSIVSRDTELLARPMTLRLRADELTQDSLNAQLSRVSQTDRKITFKSVQANHVLRITTHTQVHYDGTIRFDIELHPEQTVALNELTLEIPLKQRWASLFTHTGTGTDFTHSRTEGMGGHIDRWFQAYAAGAMPFTWAFFLGSHDRGIQWFAPSDRGWSNHDEQRKISLVRSDGEVALVVRLVDRPISLEQPLHLNFGLVTTPVKRTPPRGDDLTVVALGKPGELRNRGLEALAQDLVIYQDRGGRIVSSYLSEGNTHFGQPWIYDQQDEDLLRDFAAQVHKQGMKYRPYSGWGVHTNIPDFEVFGKEMLKEPRRNAGWGVYWHNPASTFVDWWLGGAKHSALTVGFDGIYLDGTAMPELTANELDGMAWYDQQGNLRGTYPVWELRRFMERLYILFHHELRTDGVIDLHDGREPLFFITAFADMTVTGEGHLRRGQTVLDVFDPHEFSAYYMTHLHGDARRFIWWNWMRLPLLRNEIRGMLLLHDVPMVVGGGILRYFGTQVGYQRDTRPWVRLRKLREHYTHATFLPYWESPAVVTAQPQGILASAWADRENGRALIAVVNLHTEPWTGQITLNLSHLGVDPAAQVMDAMFNKPLGRHASEPLDITLEGQRYRLFMVNDQLPLLEQARFDGSENRFDTP